MSIATILKTDDMKTLIFYILQITQQTDVCADLPRHRLLQTSPLSL